MMSAEQFQGWLGEVREDLLAEAVMELDSGLFVYYFWGL